MSMTVRLRYALTSCLIFAAACLPTRKDPSASNAPQSAAAAGAAKPAAPGAIPSDGAGLMIFLLIGQSNMVGSPKAEAEDQAEIPRVQVLAYDNCPNLGRSYNEWYPAKAPLHGCHDGVGPGQQFARAISAAYPQARIGLVPLAINGVDIDFFMKGVVSTRRREFRIPPDNERAGAYEWVLERARLAQRAGTIRGILFHQGESDTGNAPWVGKVKKMVADLRSDLALGEVPFVAGELLHSGCCGKWHNRLIAELPGEITNSRVVSAEGLGGHDSAHFDLAGQRELGARYGAAMLELLQAPAAPPAGAAARN
jgi:hypothetical protein